MLGHGLMIGAVALFFVAVMVVVFLAIKAVICYLVIEDFKRIPVQFRKLEPNMVWLLMIPGVDAIWNFFVFPKLAQSFKAYFDSVGDTTVGDCGESLSWAFCIVSAVLLVVRFLRPLAGLAALVLLIIVLVKANEMKNKIPIPASPPC